MDKNIKNELKRILEGLSFLVKKYRKDTIKFHTSYPLRCLILPLFYQKIKLQLIYPNFKTVMRTTILLFIISAAIVYGGLLLPQTLLIEEKIKINSSSSHISEYLYDLPKWEKWLYWQEWQETSDTEYIYSQFPKGVGAFMKFKEKGQKMKNEKAELYIQSILNENSSNSDFQKLKYIANFKTYQAHIEGEFELQSIPENTEESTLNFTLEIDLGENPFVRYLGYFYYKAKIEKETNSSLKQLKKLCENPVFCKK